jgi:Zn-dependent protease
MLPLPPLDGSHVLAGFLPRSVAVHYSRIGFLGVFLIILLMRVEFVASLFNSIVSGIFTPFRMAMDAVL